MPPLVEDTAEHTKGPHRSRPNWSSARLNDTVWEVRRKRTERERSRSPPNIFTSDDKNSRGISGLNNVPRGKGMHGGRGASFSPRQGNYLGRGMPPEIVRNDICSKSLNEQNNLNINQTERAEEDLYSKHEM